jgi:hypothetical protein
MVEGSFPSILPISVNEAPSLRETSIVALSSRVRCAFFAMVISPCLNETGKSYFYGFSGSKSYIDVEISITKSMEVTLT